MPENADITKPIAYIEIRVFAHATEDLEKVQTALRNLLPQELAETIVFEKTTVTGHYGNPISLFIATLTDKKLLPKALEKIGGGTRFAGKGRVLQSVEPAFRKKQFVPAV